MLTIQPDETHLCWFSKKRSKDTHRFETSTPNPMSRRCTAVDHFNIQLVKPEEGSGCHLVPKEHQLCFMCEGWTHDEHTRPVLYVCIHTHAHKACSHTRRTSASHHQWHKPSVVVFRLHWALLMQCVPYNGTHFHFHPRTAAPPFCSSHLHHSLCTHNM